VIFFIFYSSGSAGGCGNGWQLQFSQVLPAGHCELSQFSPDSTILFPQTAGSVQPVKTSNKIVIAKTPMIIFFILITSLCLVYKYLTIILNCFEV